MQGPAWAFDINGQSFKGILPRAAEHLFNEVNRNAKIDIKIGIQFAAFEIYNETIFDLFDSSKTPLQIVNAKIKNLTWNNIKSKEDILSLIKSASDSRKVESNSYNESSSRSHAVFQIKLEAFNNQKKTTVESLINIVDLAGSERSNLNFTNKSKEEVESMKRLQTEANFINKSLTTLGRVISMLADKKSNKLAIPYRESKLTMVLQVIVPILNETI
jgi:hypothetical protein